MPPKRTTRATELVFGPQWTGDAADQRVFFEGLKSYHSVEADEQYDVDITILEYLLHHASIALLNARRKELEEKLPDWTDALLKLELVQSWISYMQPLLGHTPFSDTISYRLRLLQLISIYAPRLHSNQQIATEQSLLNLREKNSYRHKLWQAKRPDALCAVFDTDGEFPLGRTQMLRHRAAIFDGLCLHEEDKQTWCIDHFGRSLFPTLRDILPLFMEVTVARANRYGQWEMLELWLSLAAELMLQATLEAYLLLGEEGVGALNEVFSFGSFGNMDNESIKKSVGEVSLLFCKSQEAYVESEVWCKLRQQYMSALLPQPDQSYIQAMQQASVDFPIRAFDLKIVSFLESMLMELPKSDLQQVEEGKIDGLSDKESEEMLSSMGILR